MRVKERGIGVVHERALGRLSPEERERERKKGGGIPYPFSLAALAGHFYRAGTEQGWLTQDGETSFAPVIAAVSGGGDSVALLWFLRLFCSGPVVCAHLNHGIRGSESDQDESFVRELAERWRIDCVLRQADVPGELRRGESLEAAARRVRYDFLEDAAMGRGAWGVALGHNREDVAETVFFNLLRGSGVRGCVGIPARRGLFFRPLLALGRDYLRELLLRRGLTWREDATNADSRHTRNFLRGSLFPLMAEKINARLVDHLVAFAEDMRYYREEEERRGDELLASASFRAAGLPAAVERFRLRAFSERDATLFVRAVGRVLDLPVLSRAVTSDLAHRVVEGKRFLCPWGGGVWIRGDAKEITWYRNGFECPTEALTAERPNFKQR